LKSEYHPVRAESIDAEQAAFARQLLATLLLSKLSEVTLSAINEGSVTHREERSFRFVSGE
jgi:hypothetical protein